jgi:hypothetical protein
MKKAILLSVILLLAGTIFSKWFKSYSETIKDYHCLTTQISSRVFDFNTVELIVSDNLNHLDFQITNGNNHIVIYENGFAKKGIKNEHGYCTFSVNYPGIKPIKFAFFKENNWQTFDYEFVITKKNNEFHGIMNVFQKNELYETSIGM